jgi:hypothetical protein
MQQQLRFGLAILGFLALVPAILIAISWRRIMRPNRLKELGRRLHWRLLLIQSFCYGTLVASAVLLGTTQFIDLFRRGWFGLPLCLMLGIACLSTIATGLRRGPLRWILVANGLIIFWNLYLLVAVSARALAGQV